MELSRAIASELAGWSEAVVEESIFGTADPAAIAEHLDSWCRRELGAGIRDALFYRTSVGCVTGLELGDGRRVVVKVQRSERPLAYLTTVQRITAHLAATGFPCPVPLRAPSPLGEGVPTKGEAAAIATAESLLDRGAWRDAHDPAVRRAVASSFFQLIDRARAFAIDPEVAAALGRAWFTTVPEQRPFPRPHSPFFDFRATREGAEWIEALALEAKSRRAGAAGDLVVAHFDWRVEHLRFDEATQVVASYDWDTLHAERETVAVGAAAHAFTADWQRDDLVRVPSPDEIRGFIADYEAARSGPFSGDERATIGAALVYALAYTARCNHAANPREEGWNGDYRPLLRAHGRELLDRL